MAIAETQFQKNVAFLRGEGPDPDPILSVGPEAATPGAMVEEGQEQQSTVPIGAGGSAQTQPAAPSTQPAQVTMGTQPAAQPLTMAQAAQPPAAPAATSVEGARSGPLMDRLFSPAEEAVESGRGTAYRGYVELGDAVGGAPRAEGPTLGPRTKLERGLPVTAQDFREAGLAVPEGVSEGPGLSDVGDVLEYGIQTGDLGVARDVLDKQYEGPSAFHLPQAQEKAAEALAYGQAVDNDSLISYIGDTVAGLSPGEARFDARRMYEDPEFQKRRSELDDRTREFQDFLSDTLQKGRGMIEERQGQYEGLREQARDWLENREGGMDEMFAEEVARRKAEQEKVERFYQSLKGQRDEDILARLRRAPELTSFDPESFITGPRHHAPRAQEAYDAIINDPKYASISHIPIGTIRVNKHGHERWTPDPEGKQTRPRDVSKTEYRLGEERFRALEQLFGPGRQAKGSRELFGGAWEGKGKYADLMPLYDYGLDLDPYESPQIGAYLRFAPGVSPARENVATDRQRTIYNRIQELLGEADRLVEAGEPWRGAQIAADIDAYLADEEAAMSERKGQLSEAREEWRKMVRKTRRSYKKSKAGKLGRTIGTVLGGIGGAFAGGIGVLGGTELGGNIGESAGVSLMGPGRPLAFMAGN